MADPADAIFVDGEVRVRPGSGRTEEALAVRDGAVCRVADTYEVEFLEGIETRRVDLAGRTVVPGFLDGHADLRRVGRRLRGTDGDEDPGSVERARRDLTAAFDRALGRGLTTVYDEVTDPETARAYHELARDDAVPIRVRLCYNGNAWPADRPDPVTAVDSLGLVAGVGGDFLRIAALGIDVGEWSTAALRDAIQQATATGFPVFATAVDRAGLSTLLDVLDGSGDTRIRVTIGETPTDEQMRALADAGATVVARPESAPETATDGATASDGSPVQGPQFGRLVAAELPVAFGSRGALPDPLGDVERVVGAGQEGGLGVTAALEVATGVSGRRLASGSPIGTLGAGTPADFAVLSGSPWETPIGQLDVDLTVVGGRNLDDAA